MGTQSILEGRREDFLTAVRLPQMCTIDEFRGSHIDLVLYYILLSNNLSARSLKSIAVVRLKTINFLLPASEWLNALLTSHVHFIWTWSVSLKNREAH